MSVLMRSISGIRGIMGDSLTPPLLLNYLNAYIQVTGASRVAVGRDTRVSGPLLEQLTAQGCAACGVEPVMLGICSTPTVEMMVPHLKTDGGVIITASHNPAEWNALKFLNKEGLFLDEDEMNRLFDIVDKGFFKWANYKNLSSATRANGADKFHIQKILELPCIHPRVIRKRRFKIAVDAVNGAGSLIVPKLLEKLGCEVIPLFVKPDGRFPRNPEPIPQSLRRLRKEVRENNCDAGFALDPDGDRCAVVSESGKAIGEEYTLVLAAVLLLSQSPGPITVNLSTSRMIEDLGAAFKVPVYRTKVGEINVSCAMKKNGSIIGGEGNGGVILPGLHYGRDGVLAVAMVLQLMAREQKTLSELINQWPTYHIEKRKVNISQKSLSNILGRLLAKFHTAELNEKDGMRFDWDDRWVHVRASNTEPVIRIIAEAPKPSDARALCSQVEAEI